jgi:hypothetical protein
MMKNILTIGAIVLVAVLIVGAVAVWALPRNPEAGYGSQSIRSGQAARQSDPIGLAEPVDNSIAGALSPSEVDALHKALDDEYKAWSTYDQVIVDLGAVRPFTSIQQAEENHIAALVTLFERYGLDVPANEWEGNVPTFDSLSDACAAGVQAEIDNAALYDELLGGVDHPDVIRVFTALQQASQTKHLPAFERCAR